MTIKIRVEGKVQGVYYRASTKDKARSLGLNGYVKNETDGSVTILASGEKAQIDDLLSWCKTGVDLARVDNIQYQQTADEIKCSSFDIKR